MRRLAAAVTLLAALLAAACGYRLSGRVNTLPADAATLAVPAFANGTTRAQAEQFVTFAVREEFLRRTRLRLVESAADADLLLEGTIVALRTTPLSYSQAGAANLYEVRLTLDVSLIDTRSGERLFQGEALAFRDTYETESGDFFSQETASLDRIAEKFAASLVTSILENF